MRLLQWCKDTLIVWAKRKKSRIIGNVLFFTLLFMFFLLFSLSSCRMFIKASIMLTSYYGFFLHHPPSKFQASRFVGKQIEAVNKKVNCTKYKCKALWSEQIQIWYLRGEERLQLEEIESWKYSPPMFDCCDPKNNTSCAIASIQWSN